MNGGTALAPSAHLKQPFFSCVPLGGHEEPSGPPLDEAKYRRLSIQFSGLFFCFSPSNLWITTPLFEFGLPDPFPSGSLLGVWMDIDTHLPIGI
jgi:hypothetical protein